MSVLWRLGVVAVLCSSAAAQTGFCTGNLDGASEPDVVCAAAGYAAAASSGSVERGAGNAPDSAGALAACCVAVSSLSCDAAA